MKFSEKLMELRKSRGWSQEQLGEQLGVTRQTVSKWELGETTPEMEKLAAMSEIFGVTTDELIKGEKPGNTAASLPEEKTPRRFHYEYKSRKSWHGLPLVHVNVGFGKYHAKGVFAFGNVACGIFAVGLASVGVVSVGIASLGLLILSCVAGLGIACCGAFSIGLFALGGAALGLFAFGGAAVGWVAFGGAAAGAYAFGGAASATQIAWGGFANGHIAIGDNVEGIVEIHGGMPGAQLREIIVRELPGTPGFITDIVCDMTENLL